MVNFTEDISFHVNASTSYHIYNVVLENVYSTNQSTNWGNNLTTTSTTTLTVNPGALQNTIIRDGGIIAYGALDLNDLGLIFEFATSPSITPGDTFLLSSGIYSFEKPLPLPDVTNFTAFVTYGATIFQVTD